MPPRERDSRRLPSGPSSRVNIARTTDCQRWPHSDRPQTHLRVHLLRGERAPIPGPCCGPPSLRLRVLQNLHAAYQGTSTIKQHAPAIVYWPGMSKDIREGEEGCADGNRNREAATDVQYRTNEQPRLWPFLACHITAPWHPRPRLQPLTYTNHIWSPPKGLALLRQPPWEVLKPTHQTPFAQSMDRKRRKLSAHVSPAQQSLWKPTRGPSAPFLLARESSCWVKRARTPPNETDQEL